MKNGKLMLKLCLDVIMIVIMILLMSYQVTGLLIHEILGTIVVVLFLVHLTVNIKSVIKTLKLPNKRQQPKVVWVKFGINILLFLLTIVMAISSLMISKNLFVFLSLTGGPIWTYLHTMSAYGLIILISIHTGFHWKIVMAVFRNMFQIKGKNKMRTLALRILALIIALLGVKASFDRGIALKFLPVSNNNGVNQEMSLTSNSTQNTGEQGVLGVRKEPGGHKGMDGASGTASTVTAEVTDGQTLNDYLGGLTCTGCGKHCSLLTPQCGIGVGQAQEAQAVYESATAATTNDSTATTSDSTTTTNDSTETTGESSTTTGDGTEATSDSTTASTGSESNYDGKIVFDLQERESESLASLFADFIPIMGLYIAGGYYSLEILEKKKKKSKSLEIK